MHVGQEAARAPRALLLCVVLLAGREPAFRVLFDKFLPANARGVTSLIHSISADTVEKQMGTTNKQKKIADKNPLPQRLLAAVDATAAPLAVPTGQLTIDELQQVAVKVFLDGHVSDRPDISHAIGGGEEHNLDWLASFLKN